LSTNSYVMNIFNSIHAMASRCLYRVKTQTVKVWDNPLKHLAIKK